MDRSIGIQREGLNSSYIINKQGKETTVQRRLYRDDCTETTVQY